MRATRIQHQRSCAIGSSPAAAADGGGVAVDAGPPRLTTQAIPLSKLVESDGEQRLEELTWKQAQPSLVPPTGSEYMHRERTRHDTRQDETRL